MQVSVEITSGLERRLIIGVPAERVESEVNSRLAKAAKTVRLKGFRPGKVPMKVVRQRFGAGVRQEVLGEVMSQSFYEAVSRESLRPAGQPQIEPRNVIEGKDLEFVATFEVFPEVELVDFGKLQIKRPVAELAEDDIDRMVEILRKQNAEWQAVEREAVDGDQVTMDFSGTRDGEAFEGGSAENASVVLGSGRLIPGFEDGLLGCKAGDSPMLSLSFPADYHVEDLREAAVEFAVTVKEVAEQRLPELDAEFLVRYGVTEGGVDEFRTEVRSNMERELRQGVRNKVKSRVLDALLSESDVELPRALVAQEIGTLRQQALQQYGGGEANVDASVLPDELFRGQAERRVALGLLISEVVSQQELKADPDKVRALVEEQASSYEQPAEVVNYFYANQEQLAGIEAAVLEDEVVECVLAGAQVEDESLSYEEALAADVTPPVDAGGEDEAEQETTDPD